MNRLQVIGLTIFLTAGIAGYIVTAMLKSQFYLADKDEWQCVAMFKDTGECAAYASKRLMSLAAQQGPST